MKKTLNGKKYIPNAFVDALWKIADAMRRRDETDRKNEETQLT